MWMELAVGALLVLLVMLFYLRKSASSRQVESTASDDEDIIVTYSKHIPGYEVKRIFGTVESSSVVPLEEEYPIELAEEATIEKLMEKAKKMGANAILELRIEKEEHATHIKVKARGLAVRI